MAYDLEIFRHQVRAARGSAEAAIVLLHGRGADEFDLLPLLDELDPKRRLVGVTVRAPLELFGNGFLWYLSREVGYPDHDSFHKTYTALGRWLSALQALLGVPFSRTVLGGFSMGAVMSHALGLGVGRPEPAAIMALSGISPALLPVLRGWLVEVTSTARAASPYVDGATRR